MTGASATRSWLQAQHLTWLTPQRMKVATIAMFSAAAIGSSATLGGSSTPVHAPAHGGARASHAGSAR
jgi:hypothetical protein